MSNEITATQVINFINKQIPIEDALLIETGVEVVSFPSQIFCPFHEDVNEPSARIYGGDKGLYCFGCGKTYLPFDFGLLKGLKIGDAIFYFKNRYNIIVPESIDDEGDDKLNNQIAFYIRLLKEKEEDISVIALNRLGRALKASYKDKKLSPLFKNFIKQQRG